MYTTFTAIYEQGILRPLRPLSLPEHARVEVRIIQRSADAKKATEDQQDIYRALIDAGLVKAQAQIGLVPPASDVDLAAAAEALAVAGPISDLVIAERAESY